MIDFQDGSVLTEADLDNATLQPLYVAAEVADTGAIDRQELEDYIDSALSNEDSTFAASATPQTWSIVSGGTASETLTSPDPFHTNDQYFIVAIDGLLQRPVDDFVVTEAAGVYTISFSVFPSVGQVIQVQNFGRSRDFNNATSIAAGAVESDDFADNLGVLASGGTTTVAFTARFGQYVNVMDYGAAGDGVTDDYAAIAAAITAGEGAIVYFPPGNYLIENTNLTIDVSDTVLVGDGRASILTLSAVSLVFDADTGNASVIGCGIKDMCITRSGAAGAAISLLGDDVGNYVERFNMTNTKVTSTGVGLHLDSVRMISISACEFTGCTRAIDAGHAFTYDFTVESLSVTNTFFVGNANGFVGDTCRHVSFNGCAFLNHTAIAIDLENYARQTTIAACRFSDDNTLGGTDPYIQAGDDSYAGTPTTGYGLSVTGCSFVDDDATKLYMIVLTRMTQVMIDTCAFEGSAMTHAIHDNPEVAAANVAGRYRELNFGGAIAVKEGTNSTSNEFQSVYPATRLYKVQFGAATLNSLIALNTTFTGADVNGLTITCEVGDWVLVASGSTANPFKDFQLTAHVDAADSIKVCVFNGTADAIAYSATTIRLIVIPRGTYPNIG